MLEIPLSNQMVLFHQGGQTAQNSMLLVKVICGQALMVNVCSERLDFAPVKLALLV